MVTSACRQNEAEGSELLTSGKEHVKGKVTPQKWPRWKMVLKPSAEPTDYESSTFLKLCDLSRPFSFFLFYFPPQ